MNAFLALKPQDMALVSRNLRPRKLLRLVLRNLADVNHYYALEMRLNGQLASSQIRLANRELVLLTETEVKSLQQQLPSLNDEDNKELLARILFFERGFRNCYALKVEGAIACLQWLVYPQENDLIRTWFKRRFTTLKPNQVMIENSFTFPRYRGFGLMQFLSTELLLRARDQGYAGAVCFVIKENLNALNQLIQMGFKIRRIVREYKLLGQVWRNW
jgi:ribosomal protein S18 acetylase RimI-like enzyme